MVINSKHYYKLFPKTAKNSSLLRKLNCFWAKITLHSKFFRLDLARMLFCHWQKLFLTLIFCHWRKKIFCLATKKTQILQQVFFAVFTKPFTQKQYSFLKKGKFDLRKELKLFLSVHPNSLLIFNAIITNFYLILFLSMKKTDLLPKTLPDAIFPAAHHLSGCIFALKF